jgi:acetolactate synthase-1/2/3 large subunit
MKGSDLLISALENEGVERIFGIPGEENLAIVEALHGSKINLVLTRHEQAAAFMAATCGRLTGKPGVCLSTLGPGALNLCTGAAYALLGAMPMILLTGQKGILRSKQGHFQLVDIVSTMTPLTKMARQIVSAATIPTVVREAFRVAQQERPGPVHLELPEDIAGAEAPDLKPISPHPIEFPVAPAAALDRAAEMILNAKRPLIMFGAAASRPRLSAPLSEFVARVRIPFFNTQMGKGAVEGGSHLYMGTAALSERDYVHRAIDRADLIRRSGTTRSRSRPSLWARMDPR